MIQDNQCNRVFFSALLRERCPIAFRGLTEVLDRYEVPWSLLEGTNDIWCRDYMPIQVLPNHFVGYDYHPDYLLRNAKDEATITDLMEELQTVNGKPFVDLFVNSHSFLVQLDCLSLRPL